MDPVQPVLLRTPAVLWCHGDAPRGLTKTLGRKQSYVLRAMEIALLPQYDRVVCVSDDLASRIASRYRGFVETTTVYNGIDTVFEPTDDTGVLDQYDIEPPYILQVGRNAPEKNRQVLLKAFADIRRDHPDTTLVLRSGEGEGLPADSLPDDANDAVITVEWLSERGLASLYTNASVAVIPSLYESFGLPAVEAMACGTVVVAADAYALPEVCDGGGVFFDPESSAELVDACNRLLTDETLRTEYEQRGRERAKEFTWDRATTEMLAVCRDVAL